MSKRMACLWVAAALVGAARAGEVEVHGKGFAQSRQPPETTDPPGSWTSDEAAHDPEEGVAFAGMHDYELKQGARSEDKAAWADTDYIQWAVNGATLVARGQVQDGKSDSATVATSEAWGGERIEVELTKADGTHGHIRAENTIGFEYDYSISGPKIGEAGVGLLATAWDLKGHAHPFSLSAAAGESVSEESEERSGLRLGASEQSGGGIGFSSKKGLSLSANGQRAFEAELEAERGFHVTRRFAQADGDSGSAPSVERSDLLQGETPLRRTYSVWSDGFVRLVARSANDGSTVVVTLHRFKVRNTLRAWKEAYVGTKGPEGGGDPGGPTTGGEDPCGPETPGDDPETPTTPGGDPDGTAGPRPADPVRRDTASIAWGATRLWARHEPSRGIDGERGGWPGVVLARLGSAQDRDLVLAVSADPPDAMDIAPRLVVAAGRTHGALRFRTLRDGPATVTLRVLDDAGAPTGDALAVGVEGASLASRPAPEIWAAAGGTAWRPQGDVVVRGFPGGDAGPLRIGRTGYAGLEEESTTVTLAADDPDGILPALPGAVTIAAGELAVPLPLVLGALPGRATITATAGGHFVTVTVISEPPSWRSVPRVVVPLGAEAAIPFLVGRPGGTPRFVVAESGAPECVAVEPEAALRPGEGAWYVLAWGTALGESAVTLRSDGLPDLTLMVEVVPERVACRDGMLELSGLDGTRGRRIHLAAPAGVRFGALGLPPAAEDYLEVSGLGTGVLVLSFVPSADMPESLSLPLLFEGAAEAPLRLDVYEAHGDPDPSFGSNSYRIEVR